MHLLYHPGTLRHWLLALMIALLPLRVWVGDAMAVALLAPPAATSVPAPCHGTGSLPAGGAHSDAASAQVHHGSHPAPTGSEGASHGGCTACDICHGPAIAQAVQAGDGAPSTQTRVATTSVAFASAVPQRGSKPPIA